MIQLILHFPINDRKEGKIIFRDSYLLLPSSLRKLAKSFNVEDKTFFPFKFVNNTNVNLDYIGDIPSIDMFDNIDQENYNNISQCFGGTTN